MLMPEKETRKKLWELLASIIEDYADGVARAPIAPDTNPAEIREMLRSVDFTSPLDPSEALTWAADKLWKYQVHTPHPGYFGLFNPAPTTMGIAADALAAAFNPQLASWSHSPFAVEAERHLVRLFGERFGYEKTDGTFTSGGAEANFTALLTALARAFPGYLRKGLKGIDADPVFYVSPESHHSFSKAAQMAGLGREAAREVALDEKFRLDPESLKRVVREDRDRGLSPFLAVATAGTTSAGIIDPIPDIAEIADEERMWLHVDAAWGGAAALVPELRSALDGIELADSITLDAHKWLSAPMGAGLYLTRHEDILGKTFGTSTAYMPKKSADSIDPYSHSVQWSRRFIGLKVLLSLCAAGWDGYASTIRHMMSMGENVRANLRKNGWKIVNETPLPVVCFSDVKDGGEKDSARLESIAAAVVKRGKSWISFTKLAGRIPVLRACVTNYRTGPDDLATLAGELNAAREQQSERL